ncbi:MAG: hypothetical protein KC656_03900 [Myxococcales bacterium]|nr:hypothetical protein [Myxococcales bacterium]
MRPDDTLRQLEIRTRALPLALRCLARRPGGLEEAMDRGDDLLAELDVLLTLCVRGPRIGLSWMDTAEEAIELKERVYGLLRPFLERMGASERTLLGFEGAARRDLHHSRRRLREARTSWPTDRPVWGWA